MGWRNICNYEVDPCWTDVTPSGMKCTDVPRYICASVSVSLVLDSQSQSGTRADGGKKSNDPLGARACRVIDGMLPELWEAEWALLGPKCAEAKGNIIAVPREAILHST